MRNGSKPVRRIPFTRPAFTLIELLVVVSIIALLISILLPSLQQARAQAKAIKCAANTQHIGKAVMSYLTDSQGVYPPSYVYPVNNDGDWGTGDGQQDDDPSQFGYLHWSHFLYSDGRVNDSAFQCPEFKRGGAPRTNPGPEPTNWELGEQENHNGSTQPTDLEDKQAPRMAYAANAAVMPRNKFTRLLSPGQRKNILVQDTMIKRTGATILATEYVKNWKAIGHDHDSDGMVLAKSHRPVNVFHPVAGAHEYDAQPKFGFLYEISPGGPVPSKDPSDYNLVAERRVNTMTNMLDHTSPFQAQINAVGRSHPGGNDKRLGGAANFLFCDGHTERMTPLQSIVQRQWGDRYYSINGRNPVHDYDGLHPGDMAMP